MKNNDTPAQATTSRSALCSLAASLGLLLIAVATLIPILAGGFPESPLYKYLYTAGAAVCLLAALFDKAPASMPLRTRRWKRIESWSAIFFCAGAFFLWYPGSTARDWLAFTLAGAVVRIIVFFRNVREAKKSETVEK